MTESLNHTRRHLLLAGGALLLPSPLLFAAPATGIAAAQTQLAALEQAAGGRLGVAAWRQGSELRVAFRADERFPLCSTFKAMLAAAVLARSAGEPGLLEQRVRYEKKRTGHLFAHHGKASGRRHERGRAVRRRLAVQRQ